MKVLLVITRSLNPKQMYKEYPLGLGFIGTILKNNGHKVLIYDGNVESIPLISYVEEFKPNVVGFSVITPNYPTTKIEIQRIKNLYPDVVIVTGGIHATLFPGLLLNNGADFVFSGEGEKVFPEFIDILQINDETKILNLPGLSYIDKYGLHVQNPYNVGAVNISELPIIDRNLYNLSRYTHHSMIASRGCPYKCKFCCNYTGTILQKGVSINEWSYILREMKYLEDNYDAKEIFFADDIFLVKKKDIISFCKEYRNMGLNVKWIAQMRVDTIDDEIAEEMHNSGCIRIYFGVESGSDAILKRTNKRITKSQLISGVRSAMSAGIRVKTGWIYGLPGSIKEQYESLDFMAQMMPHEISIHQLIPFPGTPYYNESEKYGINIKDKLDFESFCYGGISGNIQFEYLSQTQLENLIYDTQEFLEDIGYCSTDEASKNTDYIYSTPINKKSIKVFRN